MELLESPKKPEVVGSTRESISLEWESKTLPKDRLCYILQQKHEVRDWITVYRGYHPRHEVRGLGPGECYRFRLRISTMQGESPWSPSAAASTKEAPVSIENLHRAIQNGKPQAVRKILTSRRDAVEVLSRTGESPLTAAAVRGDAYMVGLLLNAGADVDRTIDGPGCTALMMACYNGNVDIARLLREKGACWDVPDRYACTALHYAVDNSQLEAAIFCIEDGADIEATDVQRWTPLMRGVVMESSLEILKELIEHGANVDTLDCRGQTCLMQAVLSGRQEIVKLLVDSGADITLSNNYYNTALDMARARELKAMVRLLTPNNVEIKDALKENSA